MDSVELIDAYLGGIESIHQAIGGVTAVQLRAYPIPGQWSILEVVCHLADSEALFAERMKRVLAETRPVLLFSDPSVCVTALAYDQRDALEEVTYIGLLRQQMARILRVQPHEAWQRVGIHSTEGQKTLEQLVCKAIGHVEHHLTFLRAKRQILEVNG